MQSETLEMVTAFDMTTDEHNFEVLVANYPDLSVLAQAVAPLGDYIYVALVESTDRRAATVLTQLAALPEFELTLVRFDNSGSEVHRDTFRVSLPEDCWRRVLHTETYWLYGALFKIQQ